eukprot:450121-Rhodomonas_salina.1
MRLPTSRPGSGLVCVSIGHDIAGVWEDVPNEGQLPAKTVEPMIAKVPSLSPHSFERGCSITSIQRNARIGALPSEQSEHLAHEADDSHFHAIGSHEQRGYQKYLELVQPGAPQPGVSPAQCQQDSGAPTRRLHVRGDPPAKEALHPSCGLASPVSDHAGPAPLSRLGPTLAAPQKSPSDTDTNH